MPEASRGSVTLFEMGPRDGLQNELAGIPTAGKVRLVNMLSGCGFTKIEVTSFVSPKWVPQMADAAEVMSSITRRPGITYAVLTPNLKGFEAALAAGASEVSVFTSASEGFSRANINCSVNDSLSRFVPLTKAAREAGLPVRAYVSCVTDCPYDGKVAPDAVAQVAARLAEMGCYQVSLADTIGAATPKSIERMLAAVLESLPAECLAGHFHDTGGRALDNIEVSLAHGIRTFDAAVGGLGGCPYAPGAKGNVATEAVAALLAGVGYATGLNADKLDEAAIFARSLRSAA